MKTFVKDKLTVEIFETRKEMGEKAASDISKKFNELIAKKGEINVIWAAAPSQNDVLKALTEDTTIAWNKINAFHMDEYIGLDKNAPQGFGNFLKNAIFGKVPFKSVNYIDVSATDAEKEADRYASVLSANKIDVVVLGIGENGHIAFNDPPVADFNDPRVVKPVKLDEVCRQQQVNDGCFKTLNDVPTHAITLTVPTLFNADYLFCIVPAPTKANAVYETINGEISTACPASILRKHDNAKLYLDADSSKRL
ncbi:MAG: glucosamine-6-phosphate deaminase [Clostridia bacterium]|nr:glucosamine-6-phosphate deaminase [Clostridia bacterium]